MYTINNNVWLCLCYHLYKTNKYYTYLTKKIILSNQYFSWCNKKNIICSLKYLKKILNLLYINIEYTTIKRENTIWNCIIFKLWLIPKHTCTRCFLSLKWFSCMSESCDLYCITILSNAERIIQYYF